MQTYPIEFTPTNVDQQNRSKGWRCFDNEDHKPLGGNTIKDSIYDVDHIIDSDQEWYKKDALEEIGNIGSAHAATALSGFVSENILIDVTRCRILNVGEIPGSYPEVDEEVATTYLRINDGDNGSILMIFSQKMRIMLLGFKVGIMPDIL